MGYTGDLSPKENSGSVSRLSRVKGLAVKPHDHLSVILGIHLVGRERRLLNVVFWSPHPFHGTHASVLYPHNK